RFYDTIARPLAETGAAVGAVDHLTKDPTNRARGGRGAGAKLQLVDVSYNVKVVQPFSRTRAGSFRIRCEKDRHGLYSIGEAVAFVDVTPDPRNQTIKLTVNAPKAQAEPGPFRPTHIMENISRALEGLGPLNTNALRSA